MKRSLAFVALLAFVLAACATTTPGTSGVITGVEANAVTVSSNGQSTTYTLGRNTSVYSPDGVLTQRSYLSEGQRVMVWSNGTSAVRINIEP